MIMAIFVIWYLIGVFAAFYLCKKCEGKVLVKDLPAIILVGFFGLITVIIAICESLRDSKFGNRKLF